jgi:hypothetical protein
MGANLGPKFGPLQTKFGLRFGRGQIFVGLRSHTSRTCPPFSICPAGRAAPRRLPLRPGAAALAFLVVWHATRCALMLQLPGRPALAAHAARAASVAACKALRGRDTHVTVLCPLRGRGALLPACDGAQPWPLVPLHACGSLRAMEKGSARPSCARRPAPTGSASFMAWEDQWGGRALRRVCEQIEMRAKL